jgi:putative transposase
MSGLPSFSFDGSAVSSAEEAFWTWRSIASPLFDVALPDPQAVGAFQVTVDSYHLGPLVLGSVTANSQQFRRSQRRRSGIVRLAKVRAYGRVPGMSTTSNPYRGFRFPAEIINQAVWLYHCFSLSLREVELILAARDIVVSYESIREWSLRFGRAYAKTLKRRRPQPGDKWFLDEVFVRIRGKLHYLWRAVDQHGNVLDVLVQSRRNKNAAKRFFRKLLKGLCYVPRVIVTDKLGSYGAAKREILPGVEHRQSRYLNNRCEVSHQPTRRRERHMRRFKSVRHAQQFLSTHSPIHDHFQLRRHRLSASEYRAARDRAFVMWREVAGLPSQANLA